MEPGQQVATPEPSLREGIEASIVALEDKEPAPAIEPVKLEGKEPPVVKEPVKETGKAVAREPVKATSITDTPPVVTQKVTANVRGPVSWKPEIREKWSGLPPEVQTEVLRREHEISRALQETADSRRFVEQFQQVAAPYQHYIALEGNDPLKAFGDYLRTASLLRGGTPAEKANAVAHAVATYGVDVQMLDSALSQALNGRPMQQQQQGSPQQFRDPRLDTLLAQYQERQSREEASLTDQLTQEVIAFAAKPENEFFEDLRGDISDFLRVAADRGVKMTLDEAYNKAAKLHPEISKIVDQRAQVAAAAKVKADLAKRRNAASSITVESPRQSGNAAEASASVRDAIEASISQLST